MHNAREDISWSRHPLKRTPIPLAKPPRGLERPLAVASLPQAGIYPMAYRGASTCVLEG